jgi:hypothetical protein
VGDAYRCHVCRLDLTFDPTTNQMVIAPFERDHTIAPRSTLIVPPAKPRKK